MTMKTEMTSAGQQPMMSSREIAELTGKKISQVHSDIRAMIPALYAMDNGEDVRSYAWGTTKDEMIAFLNHHNIQGIKFNLDDRGYVYEFLLDRRHTEILITGYDVVRRASVIDRWFSLESGEAQPRIAAQSAQPDLRINPDFAALTRTVAEATAAGVMKSILETTGIQAVVHISATVSTPSIAPHTGHVGHAAQTAQAETKEPEYVPVHKVSWATGLSDGTCRRLVTFSDLPNCYIDGIRGLCVHREFFMAAVEVLIKESTPPAKGRKRWQHPEFGGFELRKEPKEIFGERPV
ncbi:Rha family transcriptional regulator [Raoultella ornithinolytica]|uniref:Rha family transcriptional regulator n=1 Tax=Raoultella ornithinolytica TaxID=54291 RepID=UPI000A2D090E|nr:Phage regulatory protein Rha (Phage_pRha) [Raoultella ornithinolytica]